MSWKLLIIALFLTTTGVAEAQDSSIPYPIVFVRGSQIWKLETSGKEYQLTTEGKLNINPIPSPDGSMIAYVCSTEEVYELCLITIDGQGKQVLDLAHFGSVNQIMWSPQGDRLLVRVYKNDLYSLYIYDIGHKYAIALDAKGREAGMGVWSEDGDWIAYSCTPYTLSNSAKADGMSAKPIYDQTDICMWNHGQVTMFGSDGSDVLPFWEQGKLYWIEAGEKARVWAKDKNTPMRELDKTVKQDLTDEVLENENGVQVIPILAKNGEDQELLVTSLIADEYTYWVLSIVNGDAILPSLSPDGNWLTFSSWRHNTFYAGAMSGQQIYVASMKDGGIAQITSTKSVSPRENGNSFPRWVGLITLPNSIQL